MKPMERMERLNNHIGGNLKPKPRNEGNGHGKIKRTIRLNLEAQFEVRDDV